MNVIKTTCQVARKNYPCDACDWIFNGDEITRDYYTYAELRVLAKARKNKYQILKGEKYIKAVGTCGGDFFVFRGIPAVNDICRKYDIYEDC